MNPNEDLSALRGFAMQAVPRYTSYPTAPHFGPGVDAAAYAGWLDAAAAAGDPVSLYLHVPFCRAICNYCGCNTKASLRDEPIRDYADTLAREIRLVADIVGRLQVSHIHWGGGTPSLLPADSFSALVDELGARFDFGTEMEHAIELDPRYVSAEGARLLARLGVTRASLGVQDLDPAVQIAIGRVQPYATVVQAAEALRAAGIAALNFDVMYGLPKQTVATIRDTAAKVVRLRPQRIALFGYAHVPWMKTHQRLIDEAELPGAALRIALAREARAVFRDAGYEEIGIDHFALPGDALHRARLDRRLRRNFQGYTTDTARTLIGLGVSSIGSTPLGLVQNTSDNATWRNAVEAGRLPVARGKPFEGEDRLRADVIERILCYFEADVAEIAAAHGFGPDRLDAEMASLDDLAAAGWVTADGRRIAIVRHATEIARIVASRFDTYLARAGRHSVAV